jgi:hypothetical protein
MANAAGKIRRRRRGDMALDNVKDTPGNWQIATERSVSAGATTGKFFGRESGELWPNPRVVETDARRGRGKKSSILSRKTET